MRAFDVVVVGSGVAGLTAALRLSGHRPRPSVAILTKGALTDSNTRLAQGGVAAVLPGPPTAEVDTTDLHLEDTLRAGVGLCDADAVRVLVDEGAARVEDLVSVGARFDRDVTGVLLRAREGGHSRARVVHADGAATGAEVERALVQAAGAAADAVLEGWLALDVLEEDGRCRGVLARTPDGRRVRVRADHVVLATGGAGQLFAVTTNPEGATGDGVAIALRAGVPVADVEFVQFHPTALYSRTAPRPLLTEALRGEGALLVDARGERFVDELAPRDVVSRAMARTMAEQKVDHLFLDVTAVAGVGRRFPTIAATLHAEGLDPARDRLPVAPAAHYVSGGVLTDLHGATGLRGLWAAGEAACTGVHGANRLASNSLLEGLVFGTRAADAIAGGAPPGPTGALGALTGEGDDGVRGRHVDVGALRAPDRPGGISGNGSPRAGAPDAAPRRADAAAARRALAAAMTAGAGVVRSDASLAQAAAALDHVAAGSWSHAGGRDADELANLLTVAGAVVASARARTESRGAHTRTDFPLTDAAWRVRLVHARADLASGLAPAGTPERAPERSVQASSSRRAG